MAENCADISDCIGDVRACLAAGVCARANRPIIAESLPIKSDSRCTYLAISLCNKCGRVHDGGVATDQPAGWHVSFDGGLTWEYHADDPWGRLGERVAIVRPLIYGDGADWRTAGVREGGKP